MPENDNFWDLYWEMRLQSMENLGKQAAILAVSRLIRRLEQRPDRPVRLLELGCGEAQIIGALAEGHARTAGIQKSVGVDYNHQSLMIAQRDYPGLLFVEGDFTDPVLLAGLGEFDIVLLVNALHEVFSAGYSSELGEVDVIPAKQAVEHALAVSMSCMAPGGWLVLFDGLEPPGDLQEKLRVRFLDRRARDHFEIFARQYHPFHITYCEIGGPFLVELSRRDFTRYISKSIFLGKSLWQTEKLESYQYFTEDDFRTAFARQGLEIHELRTLTVNDEKWRRVVDIETPGVDFPQEHILILAQRGG
jgi:SAM-dependent methyltransferase